MPPRTGIADAPASSTPELASGNTCALVASTAQRKALACINESVIHLLAGDFCYPHLTDEED